MAFCDGIVDGLLGAEIEELTELANFRRGLALRIESTRWISRRREAWRKKFETRREE
jgi:hypothetical protein